MWSEQFKVILHGVSERYVPEVMQERPEPRKDRCLRDGQPMIPGSEATKVVIDRMRSVPMGYRGVQEVLRSAEGAKGVGQTGVGRSRVDQVRRTQLANPS